MGKKNGRRKHRGKNPSFQGKSGHYQGTNYSEVYRDGKVYVYTAWDDNAEEVGAEMPFHAWARSVGGGRSR